MCRLNLVLTMLILVLPHPIRHFWDSSQALQVDAPASVNIQSPAPGQAVQGNFVIRGNTAIDGFQSYEVDFTYMDNPTQTWFLIQESTLPVQDDILAVWDTTTITDGEYMLRLAVTLTDGRQQEARVDFLRVRNYTPIETDTPTPLPSLETLVPVNTATPVSLGYTPTPSLTPHPLTPTPLPTNPAMITPSQMTLTLGKGAFFSIAILGILGAYVGFRSVLRKRGR